VRLAQALVKPQRRTDVLADRSRGVPGASQVRADDERGRVRREDRPEGVRLDPAELVEPDVELALDPPVGVVGSPSVSEQDDAASAQCRPAAR
jgi:hypothetical protein